MSHVLSPSVNDVFSSENFICICPEGEKPLMLQLNRKCCPPLPSLLLERLIGFETLVEDDEWAKKSISEM